MITKDAYKKVQLFNKLGLHYNLVADSVYAFRSTIKDPLGPEYLPYIIAGLISFDMARMMGADAKSRYAVNAGGFATKLEYKIEMIKPHVVHLINTTIDAIDLGKEEKSIKSAYDILSSPSKDGLNQRGNNSSFHVGATKILHFINPYAFFIVDSNASRAFNKYHNVGFRKYAPQGYSADKYIECMKCAKADILEYGRERFIAIEKGTPMTRIYDKLTFVTGSEMQLK